ncbi:sulfite exporter TauE/SafE family protein [Thalassobacillus devorans]|uniref:sulfite exporter TauE/SafE family protein n=1 Tax=Thalassobacillus devorans TaxID=279813 RepID=UPI00048B3D74|nr:sulfite exporter TauE/SafE family protein [Thalassobacillus devorans]
MWQTFLPSLVLGFLMGLKHAIEPDHIVAVTTIATRSKKLWHSTLAGVFWGIGHTATIFLVGMLFITLKQGIPSGMALSLEFLVGIMLVYLGIKNMLIGKEKNKDDNGENHKHDKKEKLYIKSSFIGFVHGLAGSAAMVLLTMGTVQSIWQGALYILIFGGGTIAGMLLFTTIIGLPFVYSSKQINLNHSLTVGAGALSFLFGVYYMYNLGITEGLFALWIS